MLHKLNYPLLSLLVQVVLGPVFIVMRLTGLVGWSWLYVLGAPLALAASCVVAGLLEHILRAANAHYQPAVKASRLGAELPNIGYELLGLPRPQQAPSNIGK